MNKSPLIAGKTLDEWRSEWHPVEGGLLQSHAELQGLLGIFRVSHNGAPVYIGCARELGKGFKKRFYDLVRKGDSGRNHHGGILIHEHRHEVDLEVIVTGINRTARKTASKLKNAFLSEHRPLWNVPPDKWPVFDGPR
jgi:hypothetical protein